MKKLIFIIVLLFAGIGVFSQPYNDFTGITIFVNPGHGGNDSDDRHMIETDFWESEGNLAKGLHLKALLQNRNAEVFMSRETNLTADDLALSSIGAMANEANADFFLSIHSNGYAGTSNQPLVLYRGYTNDPVFDESKVFARMLNKRLLEKGDFWTSNSEWIAGDWTFYNWGTSGLGVLRTLEMPGVLSEGSFHDYVAEGWRLKNDDYLLHEAWAFSRTFTEYFQVVPAETGIVAGVVRNPFKSPNYYFKTGTNDEDIPVNNALVTLMPGNIEYRTGELNNGYFFFDDLSPGQYELTFKEIPDFYDGVYSFEIEADKTTLVNFKIQKDTTQTPEIVSFLPENTDSILLNQTFTIAFNMNMKPDAVEAAFTSNPPADFVFTWANNNTLLTIEPQTVLDFKTDYTVSISTAATSEWNIEIAEAFEKEYVTFNHVTFDLEYNYPLAGNTNISPYLQMRLGFNAPIDQTTVDANIVLLDDAGQEVDKKLEEFYTIGADGFYYFEPAAGLDLGASYTLKLSADLKDIYGISLGETIDIEFSTSSDEFPDGDIIESYDDLSSFWDPEGSGSTVGTVNQETVFIPSTTRKMNGTSSGRLKYVFVNDDGGLCREYNSRKPAIGSDATTTFGIWVFGDLSNNILEYWFYGSSNLIVRIGTINWAGWEFKSIPFSQIGGSGTREFHSTVIVQTAGGAKEGEIYFDDAQVIGIPSGIDNISKTDDMATLYPNPVSDKAIIRMNIQENSNITVDVYSIIGKKVAEVYKARNISGEHFVAWYPQNSLPNGIYFIRIDNGETIQNLKCIIVR